MDDTELRSMNVVSTSSPGPASGTHPAAPPPRPTTSEDRKSDPEGENAVDAAREQDQTQSRDRTNSIIAAEESQLLVARGIEGEAYMTVRERMDFTILFMVFGALVGA
jgi:spore germination cell wall hydrolase CwlJ-like protein